MEVTLAKNQTVRKFCFLSFLKKSLSLRIKLKTE